MKTKSFLLGAASLMLAASCSNDEVVNVAPQSGAIGFSSFVNNSTRGNDYTYDTLDDLLVWGVTSRGATTDEKWTVEPNELFEAREVTKNGEPGVGIWSYNNPVYWVIGNAFSFAAIAPAEATSKGVSVAQTFPTTPATAVEEAGLVITFDNSIAEADLDLLYAKNDEVTSAAANQGAVALNLKHMLSRVRFQFENGLSNGETIKIEDLKIVNATSKATITKAEAKGTWTVADDAAEFEVLFTTNTDGVSTDHKYLIPLEGKATYNITFTVLRMKGDKMIGRYEHKGELIEGTDNKYAGVALGEIEYKNNCSYTFKTKIDNTNIDEKNDPKKIEFTVTVDGWDNDTTNNTWTEDNNKFEVKK